MHEQLLEHGVQHDLAGVLLKLAQVRDLPALMAIIRQAARRLTGADGVTLVLREGDNCYYADEDAIGPLWKGQRFPLESCIGGWTMLHAEPAAIEDIYADVRIPHAAYRATFVKSLSMVPVGRDNPLGAIGCYWKDRHCPSPVEIGLQQSLADGVAVGLANIDLHRQLDEARQCAESHLAEVQRSEALFRATFEHAGTGIAHVAPDGRWLRANRKLCEIVGYPHDLLLQLTFQDITYPPDLKADLELADKLLSGEIQSCTMEKRYIHRDGHLVWASLTVALEKKANGEPDYFIAVVEDITQRKAIEETLEEERQIFHNLTDIAAEYFWELDEQFRFKAISPSIVQHSGLNYAHYIGKTRWELSFVGVSEIEWVKHRAILAAHLPFRKFVGGLPNPDGEVRWFEISGDPCFTKTGEFKGYRGVTQDITERKQAELRLQQHAMVFENSQEGVVITDAQGCVIDANASFERITEYSLDEIRGENLRILQSGRHDRSFYLNMWKSIEDTGSWQGEIWNRRKGGDIFLEWVSICAIKDEKDQVMAYVGTSVDISRMNHVQSEVERLAHYDALTGLPNRLLLISRLGHALDRVKRGGSGAVLFLDFDGFKQVNDTFGHQAGDELLIAASSRLTGRLRDADTLARLGGDEFVIILEDVASSESVETVAQDVISQLKTPFDLSKGRTATIGGSVGIALFPKDGTDVAQLIERADRALYAAKNAGKGVYRFFNG